MEELIKQIDRPMLINCEGRTFSDKTNALELIKDGTNITISLKRTKEPEVYIEQEPLVPDEIKLRGTYIFKVRAYMTKPSTPDFNFHDTWNNGIPMPFRVMQGKVLQETRGMFKMECKAVPLKTDNCIRCGRLLTHPVSRLYGIGPECGGHAHINPFETEEELNNALEEVKQKLSAITWTGWVIKSAIEDSHRVKE